jgi:hypothetical protein
VQRGIAYAYAQEFPMAARKVSSLVWVVLAIIVTRSTGVRMIAQDTFPPRLETYLTKVIALTADERKRLFDRAPVARNLEADPAKEVSVFGAVWIDAPIARYLTLLWDIENFEKGPGFLVTKKVGEPARVEDFAALTLPDDDFQDLQSCKVGDCELKLSGETLTRMRQEVDWRAPDAKSRVEGLLRQIAVDSVNAYRAGGNGRLAVYRDRANPTFVAKEFVEMIDHMPELTAYLPDMRQYLLEYPKPGSRPTTSFIYWQEADFGLKPTIRINHVAVQENADATIVASKQLYSSHYFWTALELRALVPQPSRGNGFWFVNVNRSRSDGLSGFVGRIIRGKVRDSARQGLEAALVAVKRDA